MAVSGAAETPLPYPIIADDKRELSVKLGMLDPDERDQAGMPLTARCVRYLPPVLHSMLDIFIITSVERQRPHCDLKLTAGKRRNSKEIWQVKPLS